MGSSEHPNYPKEDFDAFILRVIEAKKKRIERELDLPHLAIAPSTSSSA
jgi:hypothetical protein